MKVYVDELPEKCSKCKFCTSDYYCTLIHKNIFDYDKTINKQTRYSKCPLKTISSYTMKVIKEVCEEIRVKAEDCYGEECYEGYIPTAYVISEKKLKQIQGETNET